MGVGSWALFKCPGPSQPLPLSAPWCEGNSCKSTFGPSFTPACEKCFNFTHPGCERSHGGLELFGIGFLSLFLHPFNVCNLHLWRLI